MTPYQRIVTLPEVAQDDKENYVARLMKQALERSLLSLIKSATVKVKRVSDERHTGYHHSSPKLHRYSSSKIDVVCGKEQENTVTLDSLVKNADARREINRIFNVVSIGRQEVETRNHPLLVVAESTANYLMRQMNYIENQKNC